MQFLTLHRYFISFFPCLGKTLFFFVHHFGELFSPVNKVLHDLNQEVSLKFCPPSVSRPSSLEGGVLSPDPPLLNPIVQAPRAASTTTRIQPSPARVWAPIPPPTAEVEPLTAPRARFPSCQSQLWPRLSAAGISAGSAPPLQPQLQPVLRWQFRLLLFLAPPPLGVLPLHGPPFRPSTELPDAHDRSAGPVFPCWFFSASRDNVSSPFQEELMGTDMVPLSKPQSWVSRTSAYTRCSGAGPGLAGGGPCEGARYKTGREATRARLAASERRVRVLQHFGLFLSLWWGFEIWAARVMRCPGLLRRPRCRVDGSRPL